MRAAGLGAALILSGCAANCLRDTDCDDVHVCRHDRCELPSRSEPDADLASAGAAGSGSLTPDVPTGGAGGSASGAGGAGGALSGAGGSASVPDTSSGGTATGGRENLDASSG